MSIILFKCENEKIEEVKNKFWEILHNHYLNTVYPNTKVKYNNEREEVYTKRLTTLMEIELCNY